MMQHDRTVHDMYGENTPEPCTHYPHNIVPAANERGEQTVRNGDIVEYRDGRIYPARFEDVTHFETQAADGSLIEVPISELRRMHEEAVESAMGASAESPMRPEYSILVKTTRPPVTSDLLPPERGMIARLRRWLRRLLQ